MVKGLYTAATGMNVQAKRLEVISNDLANTTTTGYKRDVAVVASFGDVLMARLDDTQKNIPNERNIGQMTYGAKVEEVYTDFTQGSIIPTGEKTDLAIQGDGFFVVQTPNGVGYTRDGGFSIDQTGTLVTKEGYPVQGTNGPISLGEEFLSTKGEIVVGKKGELTVNGELIDNLRVVQFQDNANMDKLADNLYTSNEPEVEFEGTLIQGYLESANVNPVTAMVDMITVSRAYETNQKMIQTQNDLLGKTVNELGRG